MPEVVKSMGLKFTGRKMIRTVDQNEAFESNVIPRELSEKSTAILADDRNFLSSKEVDRIQRTFVNSSKNLRQHEDNDKYIVTVNRCQLFMDYSLGLRNHMLPQQTIENIFYCCCTLHLVTRTRKISSGKLINLLSMLFIIQ